MKDPIRIHQRQLDEMQRLLRERIAPPSSRFHACRPDTAAKVDPITGNVQVNRPLMETKDQHVKVFCECKDWKSKWPEDQRWCDIQNITQRLYEHPYNYAHEGF
eukprot:CAMPEP_0116847598 /NCGR_PEP_ID=MMETSP0418-20121206/14523_1 /TAXON_ID=1158023 /ORGANISM="Astrosyne radiata, Strain 13vi08-1A" /LENGTH=103 /DNA_ID=CAMNT_0004479061 /DNA_START=112 /DNA_END=423 /DNA_ORIENTATION=-